MPLVQEFKKFALRGNMLDLAVGFTVGAAFTTVVKSLVDDVLLPPVGLLMGGADFSDLYVVLSAGETSPPYTTLQAAQEAGAVTLNYGRFINAGIALSLVALAMFVVIRVINRLDATLDAALGDKRPAEEPTHKKCPFCVSMIPYPATRCPACTSELPPPAVAASPPA